MLYLWPDWFFETMHISHCDLCEKSHDFPLYILYTTVCGYKAGSAKSLESKNDAIGYVFIIYGSRYSRIQFRIQIQQNPVPDQIATAKNHLKHLVQLSKSAIKSPDPFPKAYPFISIHIHSYPFISIHIHSYLIVQH